MNKIKKAGKVDTSLTKSKKSKINRGKRSTINVKPKNKRITASKKAKLRQFRIKLSRKPRFTNFAPKSVIEKHIVNGKYVFSKAQQKEFNLLHKRFGITQSDYLKLYYGVRKANAKGRRLAKEGDALYTVKYSTKLGNTIWNKEDFDKVMNSVRKVLDRNYKQKQNELFKKRFMDNIETILSAKAAERINKIVEKMTAKELSDFIDQNPDIEKVMYESDPEKFTSFDREAVSLIEERLHEFLR